VTSSIHIWLNVAFLLSLVGAATYATFLPYILDD
jgi:hypothetical protein